MLPCTCVLLGSKVHARTQPHGSECCGQAWHRISGREKHRLGQGALPAGNVVQVTWMIWPV